MKGTLALVLLSLTGTAVAAQTPTPRALTSARHLTDQQSLRVLLDFAGGDVTLRPAPENTLYHYELVYDAERASPLTLYDATTGTVRLGVEKIRHNTFFASRAGTFSPTATVQLTQAIPVTIEGSITSGDTDIDLGGLTLKRLDLTTSAARMTIRFSAPTAGQCDGAIIRSHATETHLLQLGNSRCTSIRFESDAGPAVLDFSGDFPDSLRMSAEATLGTLMLRIPRSVGVRLVVDRWLAAIAQDGFTRDGNTWVSSTYATSTHRLDLDLKAAAGGVRIEWLP